LPSRLQRGGLFRPAVVTDRKTRKVFGSFLVYRPGASKHFAGLRPIFPQTDAEGDQFRPPSSRDPREPGWAPEKDSRGAPVPPEAFPASFADFQERNMDAALATCDLAEQVHGALSRSPYVSPRELRVQAAQGVVRLEGAVRSFFQKQMAQEVIRRVDGVERIENCLQVNW
jgi:hypothetical protein